MEDNTKSKSGIRWRPCTDMLRLAGHLRMDPPEVEVREESNLQGSRYAERLLRMPRFWLESGKAERSRLSEKRANGEGPIRRRGASLTRHRIDRIGIGNRWVL